MDKSSLLKTLGIAAAGGAFTLGAKMISNWQEEQKMRKIARQEIQKADSDGKNLPKVE